MSFISFFSCRSSAVRSRSSSRTDRLIWRLYFFTRSAGVSREPKRKLTARGRRARAEWAVRQGVGSSSRVLGGDKTRAAQSRTSTGGAGHTRRPSRTLLVTAARKMATTNRRKAVSRQLLAQDSPPCAAGVPLAGGHAPLINWTPLVAWAAEALMQRVAPEQTRRQARGRPRQTRLPPPYPTPRINRGVVYAVPPRGLEATRCSRSLWWSRYP